MGKEAIIQPVQSFVNGLGGTVAQRLLANGLNLEAALRTNATLRDDEWEELDRVAVTSFSDRLNAVQDLLDRDLVQNLGGLGTLVSQYNRLSEKNAAQVDMWASAEGERSRLLMDLQSVPVPAIFSDFDLDIRFIEASRRSGDAITTLEAEEAGRVVAEMLETILFNGNTTVMGGTPIYGYRTHPNRNTSSGSSWGTATNIYGDIITMVSGLSADHVPGPYILYLHSDQYIETLQRSGTGNDETEREIAIRNIPQLEDIKLSDEMTAGEAVMVAMNRRTVDLAIAEDFAPFEWDGMGGLRVNFRGMTVAAPRVKADYSGRCGVYHMTGI